MMTRILDKDTIYSEDFSDIAPYDDSVLREKMQSLVREPGFEHAVKYVLPNVDFKELTDKMLSAQSQDDFQLKVMAPFLELLAAKTTSGITCGGINNVNTDRSYTFITNHRDIVLDASFLNLCFIRAGLPISQVAIGDNLLIFDWIRDLVKINKSFIVRRGLKMIKALEAAKHLSAYIHHAISNLHQSVWIAQREGRAKDSNDVTQEGLLKMLSFAGGGNVLQNLLEINIAPVSISYELDPNDYLKATEMLKRRRDPEHRKSQRDDLFSMETGILCHKGHVHFEIAPCINEELERECAACADDKAETIRKACTIIDRSIHRGYKMFTCNYVAYDELNQSRKFSHLYTPEEKAEFDSYLNRQLDKVELDNVTAEERKFMRERILEMYANPLRNKLVAD